MSTKKESKIIEAEDFRLVHTHWDKWDLTFAKIVYANDPEKRRSEFKKIDAYGIDIPNAIRKIINRKIINQCKEDDIVFSLEEYIECYQKTKKEFNYLLEYKNYGKK